jgi:hypothetical protein
MIYQTLFTGWNWMRWLRLILGIFIAVQAIQSHDTLFGIMAAFFLFQALTNTGCCGTNGCTTTTPTKQDLDKIEDVEYEEIK